MENEPTDISWRPTVGLPLDVAEMIDDRLTRLGLSGPELIGRLLVYLINNDIDGFSQLAQDFTDAANSLPKTPGAGLSRQQATELVKLKKDNSGSASDIREVFDHWVETFWTGKGTRPKLDAKRERVIRKTILLYGGNSGDTRAGIEMAKKAISGVIFSPFHMGDNPDGKKWTELELILRNAGQVEKFVKYSEEAEGGGDPF